MTRILGLAILASLFTACLSTSDSDDQSGGDAGNDTDGGGDGNLVVPQPGQECDDDGSAVAWDFWSGDCACGGTTQCVNGQWVPDGEGYCSGTCEGIAPAIATTLDWEAIDGTGCEPGGGCEPLASCQENLDVIDQLVAGGTACENEGDCVVVGGAGSCDCVTSIYGSGVAVNRATADVVQPLVARALSNECNGLLGAICDAGPAQNLRCEARHCRADAGSCLVP